MSSAQNLGRSRRQRPNLQNFFLSFLDIVTLGAWGVLLVKYWVSNQLSLLIHPNYFGLVVITGFALLMLAAIKLFQLFFQVRQRVSRNVSTTPVAQHVSLLPPGWSNALLLATAILGLSVQPKVFNSQTAIQRGVTESTILTRAQPQSFRSASKPEDRSLIDWIRTLNVYPEPDAYTGQPVKVKGFVVHTKDLPPQYFLISRFVITCCAADAYPVGLPVKLTKLNKNRDAYPVDSWFEVKGQMITESLNGKRQLAIEASSLEKIPEPANPYYY